MMVPDADQPANRSSPHVELRGVWKRFGGVTALAGIDLAVSRATVHAVVGENGAGKSTLGRIVCGAHRPDEGTLALDGEPIRLASPRQALRRGIALISQEPTLVPQRSVLDNVFLGRHGGRFGFVRNAKELLHEFSSLAERAGVALSPATLVRELSIADQQRVTLLRALAADATLIVMDEPTSTLSSSEADQLLTLVRNLRDTGHTVIYVSHSLPEVLSIADTVTVLRDGRVIHTRPAQADTPTSLMAAMLGRELLDAAPRRGVAPGDAGAVLELNGLTRRDAFSDVTLAVRSGEIVGIAGLVGSGRSELIRTILGADHADAGDVYLDGRRVRFRSPRQAWRAGIAYIPESRTTEGIFLNRSIGENITLPHLGHTRSLGLGPTRGERARLENILSQLDVRATGPNAKARTLSGGNQQKTLLARCLYRTPRLLIADEPTRGVDVGARRAIYEILSRLAAEGLAVLLVTSETEEVLALAGRIVVMRAGCIVAELNGHTATEEQVLRAALGLETVA